MSNPYQESKTPISDMLQEAFRLTEENERLKKQVEAIESDKKDFESKVLDFICTDKTITETRNRLIKWIKSDDKKKVESLESEIKELREKSNSLDKQVDAAVAIIGQLHNRFKSSGQFSKEECHGIVLAMDGFRALVQCSSQKDSTL